MIEQTLDGATREVEGDVSSPAEINEEQKQRAISPAAAGAVSALALATAACGGGGSGGNGGGGPIGGTPTPTPTPTPTVSITDAEASRFLQQASLAATPGDIDAVKSQGYEAWLNAQIAQPIELTAEQFLKNNGYEDNDANRWQVKMSPLDWMMWNQLITGNNEFRKRAALALSEFFVVSANTVNGFWRSSAMGAYWDILTKHAFGNYRDLVEDISLNLAMGIFLNTRGNRKEDPNTGRVPDENYGREVMQLFSIGLYELNLDGTEKTDGSGNLIETYDNDDVTGIAKAFTGYDANYDGITFETSNDGNNAQLPHPDFARLPMTADSSKWRSNRNADYHSMQEKTFLGVTIPANTNAVETLRLTMDALTNHPNVGPFLGKQMIQRLVTSNPSPAYVQRVAQVFNDNGSGVRGDLRAMFKAILLDDEARSTAGLTSTQFGKLREPMLRFTQFARTFGATSARGDWRVPDLSDSDDELGQSPLRPPSVFNFFRPGFVPTNSQSAANNLLAPEFQIVNETSVAGYVNFMQSVLNNAGTNTANRDLRYNLDAEVNIAHDSQALIDRLDLLFTANQLTASTKTTIKNALDAESVTQASSTDDKLARVRQAILLVMVSNEYLVQQ